MSQRWLMGLLFVAGALVSCGPKPKPPAPSEAPVAAPAAPNLAGDTAAAASLPADQPNFRVCLSSADAAAGPPLTVPAGVIFISWGRKNGDERNPVLDAGMLKPGTVRYAVVLSRPVTLSTAAPCAETIAQTAHSDIFEFTQPLVRKSQDLQFAGYGVENHMAWPLTNRLGEVVKKALIYGYPTADIGHPRQLKEEG
jgi:hypothetical protein